MIPVTFKVTGEAPRAQWLRGEDDGVEPDLGGPNRDVFTFRAVYHDPDWWRPKVAECLVYRFSVEEGLKLFRRLPLGSVPGEGNGQVLGASTTLPLGVYRYRFRFESSDGHDVGGEPTATQRGPVVVGPPRLYWAGQPGFEKNGVDPDRGAPGTTFSFRVLYQDSDGQRPSEAWLVIRRDGKTQGKKGMASHGGSYYRGTAYRTTLRLSTPGDYEYAFRFADDSGPAVGEPTHWQPGPRVGSAPRRALAVTSLAAVPVGGGVQLRFALSVAADVTAQVLNGAGRPVRRVCTGRPCEAGATALPWDGRDDAGLRVPGGTYLLTLTAIARDGQCTRAVGAVRLDR
jgi:hypothetical protein